MGSCSFSKKSSPTKMTSTIKDKEPVKKEIIVNENITIKKKNSIDLKKEAEKFMDFEEYGKI